MESISGSAVPLKSKVCRSDKVGSSELKVMRILLCLLLCQSTTAAVKEVLCQTIYTSDFIFLISKVSSVAYQALPAHEKADRLWSNCLEDKSSEPYLPRFEAISILLTQPVCPAFRFVFIVHDMDGYWEMIIKVCNCNCSEHDLGWKYHDMTKLSSSRTPGDELAKNFRGKTRVRSIHRVGMVGKVQWRDLGGHPYSGIFKGAKHGLAR